MRLRHLFALCGALWLAGCATTTPTTSDQALTLPSKATELRPLKPLAKGQQPSAGKVAALEAPADLWERIRRGYNMPDLEGELVTDREQWYSSRPDYIQRMTERSSKYLFHIVEELERRNMPTELALLPYIESAFNPQAVSSAKAAGMWQFMPATGTYFDLKQNIFRDDRRDVLASTRAALDYLDKLYRMFGDWHLALAAYNWGEGNVARAIKRNEKAGLGTSYAELNMPAETRLYVPKLQAVKNIVANPEAFDAELPNIGNHPYFQVVELKRDMDPELVARLADIRLADFKALNPSLNKPIIFAAVTPQILLPWDNAKVFQRNLEAYDEGQYASWTVWVVPSTMTVADAAQRVGMSESDLRNINNIPPRMLIKGGSALMVPRTAKHVQDVSGDIADNASLSFAPEVTTVTRRTAVRVGRGDNLATLAKRHKVSVADLARWNDISTKARLRAGQSLNVYVPVRVAHPGTSVRTRTKTAASSHPTKKAPAVQSVARASKKSAASSARGGTPAKRKR